MSASATASRRVRRLHLVAPDATLHGRGVRLIEDAMRTATLADAGARVTVIRRFALARFGAAISPQALALALERRVAALTRDAVHAADPAAPFAPAVWFRDALEAHTLLASRIAEGAQTREWFWPLAIPAVATENGERERLRAVVLAVSRLPEARAALQPFVRALAARGLARNVVECLHESDASPLIAASGLRAACEMPPAFVTRTPGDAPPPALAPIASLIEHAGFSARDARVRWMAALLAPAESAQHAHVDAHEHVRGVDGETRAHPLASGARRVANEGARRDASAASAPEEAAAAERIASAMRALAVVSAARARDADEPPPMSARASSRLPSTDGDAPAPQPTARDLEPAAVRARDAPDTRDETAIEQAPWPCGAPTAAGGLLFLLVVLERVGYPRWLAGAPQREALAIERRVLARVCGALRVPRDDPAWALTTIDEVDRGHDPLVDAVARAWLSACRRWLRRRARTSLAALVLRPARLSLTPTHVDVEFPLSSASIEVRCAGLDVDPGWVPWFGRVVAFHYSDRGQTWT